MQNIGIKKIIKYAIIIVFLIIIHLAGILTPVESFIAKIFNPVFKYFYSAGDSLNLLYSRQINTTDFAAEADELKKEVERLTIENVKLKVLEDENIVLREHLNFLNKHKAKYLLANIISKSGNIENQMLIIDKGSSDGVFPGLGIVSGEGIIIGKIIAVKNNLSEACLSTNPACKLAATIQNSGKTTGIVEGELGLTIQMKFIPQTEEIKNGDMVITSGLEKDMPRGLVIGKVAQVKKENNALWQSATIEPLKNMNELGIISVLIP